jgi:ribosome-associated protein
LIKRYARWKLESLELARTVANLLEEKKGEDIILMDIHDISDFADYFVICSGTSDRMLKALADDLIEQLHKKLQVHARVEGVAEGGWVLVDFGNVIVHLFSPDRRDYYRLEDLWAKGKILLRLQ